MRSPPRSSNYGMRRSPFGTSHRKSGSVLELSRTLWRLRNRVFKNLIPWFDPHKPSLFWPQFLFKGSIFEQWNGVRLTMNFEGSDRGYQNRSSERRWGRQVDPFEVDNSLKDWFEWVRGGWRMKFVRSFWIMGSVIGEQSRLSNWDSRIRTMSQVWKRQVYLSMKFGRWLEWRIGLNGRTRNLPTGTDHLPDHSLPTPRVVPGIQTGDHLRIRDRRIYWTLCTVNFRIGLLRPIPLW